MPTAAWAQQAPQVKVQIGDLDLTKDAGVRTANNRLRQGVSEKCAAGGQDLHSVMDENACRKDLLTKGRGKIAAAAAKSDADKLAEQRHLAEVSIHPRSVRRVPDYHRTPGQVTPVRHAAPRHKIVTHKAVRHPAAKHAAAVAHHATRTTHKKH
jgi:UrcA family protein